MILWAYKVDKRRNNGTPYLIIQIYSPSRKQKNPTNVGLDVVERVKLF